MAVCTFLTSRLRQIASLSRTRRLAVLVLLLFLSLAATAAVVSWLVYPNPSGLATTMSVSGSFNSKNAFFQSLGTNGRSCVTCHAPSDGMSVTPGSLQLRFLLSQGKDPIFRAVDGANCPSADVSTSWARAKAYSLLLKKGLIRVSITVPDNSEFSITSIDDPYNCTETTQTNPALYRRPLPASNLRFLTGVMWDARESAPGGNVVPPADLNAALKQQALDATMGHAQASSAPSDEDLNEIVAFELGIYNAQSFSNHSGSLDSRGAAGGPVSLSQQQFFVGINDSLTPGVFDEKAFTLFNSWTNGTGEDSARRQSVARGQAIFNSRQFQITGVNGLNDLLGTPSITGTCTTCHDSPNVGNHSKALALNIGLTDASRRTADMPLYTVQCNSGPLAGQMYQVTDLGRAMISGKCADVGKFKGPILRDLAARAPYFHNGSAATLNDAVRFYDDRFLIGLTEKEKTDLVAFLSSL